MRDRVTERDALERIRKALIRLKVAKARVGIMGYGGVSDYMAKADAEEARQSALVVDCRGEICPMPVFMVKKALGSADLGQVLEVIVGDDSSKQNVLRYCWNHGQEIFESHGQASEFHMLIRKSPEKMSDKPLPAVGPCGTRWD